MRTLISQKKEKKRVGKDLTSFLKRTKRKLIVRSLIKKKFFLFNKNEEK